MEYLAQTPMQYLNNGYTGEALENGGRNLASQTLGMHVVSEFLAVAACGCGIFCLTSVSGRNERIIIVNVIASKQAQDTLSPHYTTQHHTTS